MPGAIDEAGNGRMIKVDRRTALTRVATAAAGLVFGASGGRTVRRVAPRNPMLRLPLQVT